LATIPCTNKNVFIVKHALLNRYHLLPFIKQFIELVYAIGLVSDPITYSLVLLHWCRQNILPEGNLAAVVIDNAYILFGGLGYSPNHVVKSNLQSQLTSIKY
jgi:hypothetical protein